MAPSGHPHISATINPPAFDPRLDSPLPLLFRMATRIAPVTGSFRIPSAIIRSTEAVSLPAPERVVRFVLALLEDLLPRILGRVSCRRGVLAGFLAGVGAAVGAVAEGLSLEARLHLTLAAVGSCLLGTLGVDLLLREVVGTAAGWEDFALVQSVFLAEERVFNAEAIVDRPEHCLVWTYRR